MKNFLITLKKILFGIMIFSFAKKKVLFAIMKFRFNETKEVARLSYIIYKNTLTTSYLFQNFIN